MRARAVRRRSCPATAHTGAEAASSVALRCADWCTYSSADIDAPVFTPSKGGGGSEVTYPINRNQSLMVKLACVCFSPGNRTARNADSYRPLPAETHDRTANSTL